MFKGSRFLIIDNGLDELEKLIGTLEKNNASVDVKDAKHYESTTHSASSISAQVSQIIATTTSFPEYQSALSAMIPITDPKWVWDSINSGKPLNPKPYSPTPSYFFKDVYVCVADSFTQVEKDFIYGLVRAFGGQYLDSLTKFTTHLISEDIHDDKSLLAASAIGNINIVKVNWIEDCLRAQKKLDENLYLTKNDQEIKVESINPVKSSLLQNKIYYIDENWNLSPKQVELISELIENNGGKFTKNLDQIDVLITKYRHGKAYFKYKDNPNVHIGTLTWLYFILSLNHWVNPISSNLLHFPSPKQPIDGFNDLKISITNYSGDARFYLSTLITLMGGTFTKTLTKENDYLIAAQTNGKKYEAVKYKWNSNVKIVNHLWLEDCYSNWCFTPWNKSRYEIMENHCELLGQVKINVSLISIERLRNTKENNDNTMNENESELSESKSQMKRNKLELETPIKKQKLDEELNSSRSRRSAAKLAAEKLHTNINDLNDYQQMSKSVRKTKEYMDQLDNSITPSKIKPKSDSINALKKNTESVTNINFYALFTGCEQYLKLSRNEIDALKKIGIVLLNDYSLKTPVDLLVAPRILRTEKFLKSFGQTKYVVHPQFILDIVRKLSIQKDATFQSISKEFNLQDYTLENRIERKQVEEALGFNTTITNLLNKPKRGKVFENLQINLSSKLDGGTDVISRILKAHACLETKEIKSITSSNVNSLLKSEGKILFIVHPNKDAKLIASFKKLALNGYTLKWEWCVKSIFASELQDYETFKL